MTGKVYLVGAGPGDAKLITLRAVELLQKADIVLYDRLVSKKIISMIPQSTEKIYVGREVGDDTAHQNSTNELMVKFAKSKKNIVRLKGGDPIIFGRGGEEAEYLKENKVKYEIVPGITSGIGSATYAGIPLTHRKYASSVVFVTGHEDPEKNNESVKWKRLAKSVDTIVIMMGLSRIDVICKELIAGGLDKKTPVAVIQNGTTPQQKMVIGTVTNIAKLVKINKIKAPSNIIIGKVVDLSKIIGWRKNA
ncbi:MAG: uroporphyrinogen-III C-methyltransferase [Nitrosarchaeum sp.]|jgi:uroporphyrin-III C-methyltransferase|nr:uroporphyrinogen-III C-methyltransferase [Nitrosarchaeum sp.]MBP0120665.1 uroporphyrinogen-III C-methyltransferase [Nitrosarchaeum sp.]MBP0134195.1 uroporphyrinogen-III C-methyltransferase [Nitrosarchaeum sp.]MDW7641789.1 uroporphyrinogen-III C-methyltransferase [Nitrosarchaeum sp.]MSV26080.1 uroporphyrinogen-III C-methyltransferase [Nitrosarchaeum sp.]